MKSEEFFREVDEDLQRDRMVALWQRYGGYVVTLAVLTVAATAGWVGWRAWEERQDKAEAARYAAAVGAVDTDPAAAATRLAEFAREADTGYAALARLREAQARASAAAPGAAATDAAGADAAAPLEALAQDATADPLMRDLGALLAAARELDRGDPAALKARLESLAGAGSAFRFSARELLALLSLRTGDAEGARRQLEELTKEAGLPAQQGRRLAQLLAALGGPPAPPPPPQQS